MKSDFTQSIKNQESSINKVQSQKAKNYDLEERTLKFAESVIALCRRLPKNLENIELLKQLIRSAGSVGANYREACEALSEKDFYYRLRITKKEAKESHYWLRLLRVSNSEFIKEINLLVQEAIELVKMFSKAILKQKRK